MNKVLIINFVNLLANIYMVLIFIRVIFSWIPGTSLPRIRKFIYDTTEPLLRPLRKILPPLGGTVDLSPIVAYLLLYLLQVLIGYI